MSNDLRTAPGPLTPQMTIAEMGAGFFWTRPEPIGFTQTEIEAAIDGTASPAAIAELQAGVVLARNHLESCDIPGSSWWMSPKRAMS